MIIHGKNKTEYHSLTEFLMVEPEANSRFVFLLQGVGSFIGLVVVSVGFLFAAPATATFYTGVLTALGAGATGSAIGRFFTKKAGGPSDEK